MNIDDELIEMEVAPLRRSRGPPNNRNNRRTPVLNREIIDLTGDPSSPSSPEVELHATSQIPHHLRGALGSRSNNPRRQNANLQRTPSLARSDGSLLGNGSRTIPIDLTIDDEPAPRQQPPPPPPNVPALPQHPIRHGADNPGGNFRAIFQNQFLDNFSDIRQHLNRTFGNLVNRQVHNFELDLLSIGGGPANPLGDNMPNLHYAVGLAGRRHESPRPKHVAPSPAPEGFTRNTGGDDLIVCAGCEEELQFCPEDEDAKRKAPPAKKARSRKDMEEHFFWALKDCGHVYCKTCYDKRSTKKGSPFVPSPDNNRKLTCAIPDCSTEVGTKYAWVGLFL
ncbi:hypothetical protein QBC38DRAFT_363456 [Podospora fimiseda]|uniref:Cell cycle control protein n=1 Tax=Podospora fimiseda TaxID=252190 RepID=A0AAN7BQL2_9PEZI|nr:hypothetical protein QBC38DRAFT_363456 [Podospora fimiseda]